MTIPTPLTDAERKGGSLTVPVVFAERLERRLALVTAERDRIKATLRKFMDILEEADRVKSKMKSVQKEINSHL